MIADPDLAAPIRGAVQSLDGVRLVEPGELAPAPGAGDTGSRTSEIDELATATLLFTSGTTGPSKACALSHRYLVRQAQLHAEALGLHSDDVLHSPFPLFHIDAATLTVGAALAVSATAAVGQWFSRSGFWDEIRACEATVFNVMGATLSILWKQPPTERVRDHRLRLGWGVPIPQWWAGFEQRFGVPLRQVYGLTDAGVPVYDPVTGPRRPGAAGRVLDAFQVRIDADGAPAAPGLVGEILVRGREPGLVMNGYHGMPEATAATIVDGWVPGDRPEKSPLDEGDPPIELLVRLGVVGHHGPRGAVPTHLEPRGRHPPAHQVVRHGLSAPGAQGTVAGLVPPVVGVALDLDPNAGGGQQERSDPVQRGDRPWPHGGPVGVEQDRVRLHRGAELLGHGAVGRRRHAGSGLGRRTRRRT
ncbi:MAG: AMP-binding protein, partial [Kineosporiaceae bacterium]